MLDPAASSQLEPGRRAVQGLRRRGDHRPAFLALLHRGGPRSRHARARAARRPRERAASTTKAGGCARTARRFWANVVIDPIRDATGELIGFAKVTRDLTERQRAEEALRRERGALPPAGPGRHRLRHLHAGPDGPHHQLERRRRADQGLPAEEIIGQHFSLFYTEEDARAGEPARRSRPPRAKAASRRRAGACARTARASGPRRHRSDPRRRGELIGFAKITRDITERRQAQQELDRRARRCSSRRRWKRSASSPAASRTTSTIC